MGIRFYRQPKLEKPELIAAWPGIGNIGLIAYDTLRGAVGAEEFAEIEPWNFFYPRSCLIKEGKLEKLEFPGCKFYFKRMGKRDLLFFIGEEQPAESRKIYEMANLVLDMAFHFGCTRVYTAGAAVAPIHHTMKPRVWAVPNQEELIKEVKGYENTVIMSEIEGRGGQGNITGLNGLLLGVAKKRGLPGICLLGEIPIYVSQLPMPYPKSSKSILEVLTTKLEIKVDLSRLDYLAREVEGSIEAFYQRIPAEIRQRLDQLKYTSYIKEEKPGPITEEDKKRIIQEVEEFFKKGGKEA